MSPAPALKPGQPVGKALLDVAAAILAEAQGVLDDRTRAPTLKVHDTRRAMKRWRAFLRMMEPFVGEGARQLRIDGRELARSLGAARDAQSAIDAFDDATKAGDAAEAADAAEEGEGVSRPPPLSAQSLKTIRKRLESLRDEGERSLWNDAVRAQIADYLAQARAQVAQWDLDAVRFDEFADMLAKTYRRGRRAVPESWEDISPEELHELRRRVVEHRYQMELIEPLWPRLGRIWVDEAQRLRTRLGRYQDLAVLGEKAALRQPLAHWRAKLAPLIAERQDAHAKAARKVAARLYAEPSKAFRRRLEALWESQTDN